ncbi:MAG TPA: SDR family oxidoreductase [Vicinamibacterales bacterium]|nr:SDR family oxidoreductase [Vicinamibacterales bacterium]
MTLTDRVVLLTGARRVGAAVAEAVAVRGADVAITYNRSRDDAEATASTVRAAGRRALVVQADVSQEDACDAMIRDVEREFGRLDVLLNMASLYESVPFDNLTPKEFDRQLGVDLRGSFLASRAAVPLMRRHGGGRIINFADWVAASGRPRYKGYVAYYVAKAGVKALTEALALELAADQILVNAIAPGPILAPPGTSAEEHAAVEKATPLGRWGGPGEIAKAVVALIDSDFITGETIRVDGGRHIS